jgi:hypothetical protein
MRQETAIRVSPADRRRLETIVADRNSPQKHVWRAKVALAAADGLGTTAIGRYAGLSRPSVRRWRERFVQEGVAGLLQDKTRKPGTPPLLPAVVDHVVGLTLQEPLARIIHEAGRREARGRFCTRGPHGIALRTARAGE